jgi:hypothetical protein
MKTLFLAKRLFVVMGLIAAAFVATVTAGYAQGLKPPTVDEVKKFFATLQTLGENYDPGYIDLFSDKAYIENTRREPGGSSRVAKLTGVQYKAMIAKVKYTVEGEGVRIRATRFAERKNYRSPISFLVVREAGGLKIIEEISVSQP